MHRIKKNKKRKLSLDSEEGKEIKKERNLEGFVNSNLFSKKTKIIKRQKYKHVPSQTIRDSR